MLLLHLNNSVVCFHNHLHFLRFLQRSQAQQQKFFTREKKVFRWKKMHNNVEKKLQVWISDVSREQHIAIHAITDIHCCFSRNIIICCTTCFAQIEMLLYNAAIQRSRWANHLLATKLLYT